MKSETLGQFILTLDGMIAAMRQTIVLGGRTAKEREACGLLVDARLKLVEELESREDDLETRMSRQSAQFEEDKNYYSSWGLHEDEL